MTPRVKRVAGHTSIARRTCLARILFAMPIPRIVALFQEVGGYHELVLPVKISRVPVALRASYGTDYRQGIIVICRRTGSRHFKLVRVLERLRCRCRSAAYCRGR
jgi:hypothetical protein